MTEAAGMAIRAPHAAADLVLLAASMVTFTTMKRVHVTLQDRA